MFASCTCMQVSNNYLREANIEINRQAFLTQTEIKEF